MVRECVLVKSKYVEGPNNYSANHEYQYKFNDKNLVIEERDKVNGELSPYTTTYEYEEIK